MKESDESAKIMAADPFLAGRTEACERYGHLAKNAAQWRLISIILMLCCAACVMAVISMSRRVSVVPYIVQVDEHGYDIAVAPVAPSKVDSRVIIAHVARYVLSLKSVFSDPDAQLHFMRFIYNSTPEGTSAAAKYRKYYSANNPLDISKNGTVSVAVNSVLSLSSDTWQVEWTEERFTTNGNKVGAKHYRGIFSTAVNAPSTMQDIIVNPLGIFITDFDFSEIL